MNTAATPFYEKQVLWEARQGGYHNYRIPALIATPDDVVLATGEARQNNGGDWDNIDIVMRRSTDGGRTWGPSKVVVDHATYGPGPISNFCPIWNAREQQFHFLYCWNYERVFHMTSPDGEKFSAPVEITSTLEKFRPEYAWNVVATGPAHGLQLRNGRLLMPVWLSTGGHAHRPSVVSTIYSDDAGQTWQRGAIVAGQDGTLKNPSETIALELQDGRVMLNLRHESESHRRAVSISPNGADHWSKPVFDDELFEPVCMSSILRLHDSDTHRDPILFVNPDSRDLPPKDKTSYPRANLTARLSSDEAATWPVKKVMEAGVAGYSDLAQTRDGSVLCLYECGGLHNMYDTQSLAVARFNLSWLMTEG